MAAVSGIVLDSLSSGAINLGAAGLEWVFLAGITGTLAVRSGITRNAHASFVKATPAKSHEKCAS